MLYYMFIKIYYFILCYIMVYFIYAHVFVYIYVDIVEACMCVYCIHIFNSIIR